MRAGGAGGGRCAVLVSPAPTRSLAHSLTHTHSHYDRNFFTASELTQSDKDQDYCKLLYPELLCMLVQAAVTVTVEVAVAQ